MKKLLILNLVLIFLNPLNAQDVGACNCKGVVDDYQSPIENFNNLGINSIYIQTENGVPFYFKNKMMNEVKRFTPDATTICTDIKYNSFYVPFSVITPTLNWTEDGDYSIRIVDPFDPSPSAATAAAITYQKLGASGLAESDISLNVFFPDFNLVKDVATSGAKAIDGGTVIRHELGHLYGMDHDPDDGTLMFADLSPGIIKDIDCDIQEAYHQVYNCRLPINKASCPWALNHNIVYNLNGNLLNIIDLNEDIKSIYLFKKTSMYKYQLIDKKNNLNNSINFNLDTDKEIYYQLIYENNKSILYKL